MKTIKTAIALLAAIALLTGFGQQKTLAKKTAEITVTDMTGRIVTLAEPAEKIVALTASDCEILHYIGAIDTLVGRGIYCDYPPEIADVPAVESGGSTNVEQIIALKPQVVLMNKMGQIKEQVEQFEKAGIQVIVSDAADIEGVYTSIELIGAVTGKTEEAAEVVNAMKETFDEIIEKADGDGSKSVYFEVSPLEWGLWTAGSGTFMDELAEMLGLVNAFADVEGWGEISEEQVLSRDPDYIVTVAMYFGDGLNPVDEIISRTGWQDLKAVTNGNVLLADSDEISRPGPRLAEAAKALYSFVYKQEKNEK